MNEELYSFSPEFMNMFNAALQQDMSYTPEQQEQVSPEEDDVPVPDVPDEEEELQSQFEAVQAENERLRHQIETFKYSDNDFVRNDDLMKLLFDDSGDGNTNVLDMVLNDEISYNTVPAGSSNLSWVKTKTSSVNIGNLDPRLSGYLNSLPFSLKNKVVVTSGNDSKVHVKGSKHYENKGLDLRFSPELHSYIENDPVAKKLGIKTINPNHGTAKHTHIQVNQYGGKYRV